MYKTYKEKNYVILKIRIIRKILSNNLSKILLLIIIKLIYKRL